MRLFTLKTAYLFGLVTSYLLLQACNEDIASTSNQDNDKNTALVKLSKQNLCHDHSSPYFKRIKKYKAYQSLDECFAAGGELIVKKGIKVSYQRHAFGHWQDEDKDCQNTRHEVLISSSLSKPTLTNDSCQVIKGNWYDDYTGKIITEANKLDIDHIVPLKYAWLRGADQWTKHKRIQFSNDPLNLKAVSSSSNRSKGAKGYSKWLPSNESYRDDYVRLFLSVCNKYELDCHDK